jgi:hypothetical protein
MGAALRNASPVGFWLNLLRDGQILNDAESNSMIADCKELINLLSSITKTTDRTC